MQCVAYDKVVFRLILIHACAGIAIPDEVGYLYDCIISIHACARIATNITDGLRCHRLLHYGRMILIHACARIVTFYAGIVSKEEVILIYAYARIAALLLGGSVIVLIHACARIVAGSG